MHAGEPLSGLEMARIRSSIRTMTIQELQRNLHASRATLHVLARRTANRRVTTNS